MLLHSPIMKQKKEKLQAGANVQPCLSESLVSSFHNSPGLKITAPSNTHTRIDPDVSDTIDTGVRLTTLVNSNIALQFPTL